MRVVRSSRKGGGGGYENHGILTTKDTKRAFFELEKVVCVFLARVRVPCRLAGRRRGMELG